MSAQTVSTAMLVAAGTLLHRQRQAGVQDIDCELARACLGACPGSGARLLALVESRLGRVLLRVAQHVLLPGLAGHYHWRKRLIARWVQADAANGMRQLIVLGAGFDALALRTTNMYPSVHAIELDLPIHQGAKRIALECLCVLSSRLNLAPANLASGDVLTLLGGLPCFDPSARTTIVAEGLLMYLRPDFVTQLFAQLGAAHDGPVHVIGTAMETSASGQPGFRHQHKWVQRWLQRRGESFLWGCHPDELRERLLAFGLHLDALAPARDLHDPDPCPGEQVFRAVLHRQA